MSQNICKCFISHTSKDIEGVRELKRRLEAADPDRKLKIWIYEDDTQFGRRLEKLAHDIRECDFLIVFLSEESIAREFVQRELGLALALSVERASEGLERPIILGVSASDEPASGWNVPVRDFDTGKLTGSYAFGEQRYYKLHMPHIDRIEQLAQYIIPRIRFWGKDFETEEELFSTRVFDIYEKFFPEEEERDDPADICKWLAGESWRKENFDYGRDRRSHKNRVLERVPRDWGSVFGVLEIAGRAVGMVYLTAHLRSGWIFGNYFGVLQSWRAHERAKSFIDESVKHTRENLGNFKGVVFEVERYSDTALEEALRAVESIEEGDDEAALGEHAETVRAVMRIGLYQKRGALLLVNRKLGRIEYRQPAMNDLEEGEALTPEWIEEHEWPLWLMLWPIDLKARQEFDLEELIDFVYLDLFGSYSEIREPLFNASGLSFYKYLLRLRDECLTANGKRTLRRTRALGIRELTRLEKTLWTAVMKKRLKIKL